MELGEARHDRVGTGGVDRALSQSRRPGREGDGEEDGWAKRVAHGMLGSGWPGHVIKAASTLC
jgi:hypothetical protein